MRGVDSDSGPCLPANPHHPHGCAMQEPSTMRIYPGGATLLVRAYLGREGVSLKISQVEFVMVWVHSAFPSHQDPDFPCAERLKGCNSTVVFKKTETKTIE